MKLITLNELEELSRIDHENSISIFIPTHRLGKEVLNQNDAKVLKNHYQDLKKKLIEKGMHETQVEKFLEPINNLLKDGDFWRHQLDGLAVFLSDGFFKHFRLPVPFKHFHLLTNSFYLKPLAQTFSDNEYYYILALSLNSIKLFEANKYFIHEIDLHEHLPDGVEQILNYYQFEESLQFRSGQGGMNSGENAHYSGQGASKQDVTPYIEEYFRHIDDALSHVMTSSPRPMILAAVDYLHPIFKSVTKTSKVVNAGIMGNPEHLKPNELHQKSKGIMNPVFTRQRNRRIEKYNEMAGTGKTSNDINEIARAAIEGRVEALFVTKGINVWGKIHENNGDRKIEMHNEFQTGDNCLIDKSVIRTLLNGGETYLLEKENIPVETIDSDIAAVFRY